MTRNSDRHKIDLLAEKLHSELKTLAQAGRRALQDDVPMGMRRMTPEEKFQGYMQLTPQQRDFMRTSLGDQWQGYEEEQLRFAVGKLGAAAMNLLPYIAPHMAMAMEVERNATQQPQDQEEE